MPPTTIALLTAQGLVFLVWAILAFRWLFALRADAVAESGQAFPGLGPTLRAFRGGFIDRRYARDRLWLGVTTVVMLALAVLTPALRWQSSI